MGRNLESRMRQLEGRKHIQSLTILFAQANHNAEQIIQEHLVLGATDYLFWPLPKTLLDE